MPFGLSPVMDWSEKEARRFNSIREFAYNRTFIRHNTVYLWPLEFVETKSSTSQNYVLNEVVEYQRSISHQATQTI